MVATAVRRRSRDLCRRRYADCQLVNLGGNLAKGGSGGAGGAGGRAGQLRLSCQWSAAGNGGVGANGGPASGGAFYIADGTVSILATISRTIPPRGARARRRQGWRRNVAKGLFFAENGGTGGKGGTGGNGATGVAAESISPRAR